jgi:translocation and assembly module TamB
MDMRADDAPVVVKRRPWRFLVWIARGLGILVLVVVLAVVALVLNLDRERVRGFVTERVNAALAPSFRGRIHIDRLGGLSLLGISKTDITVFDPTGAPVIVAKGVRVSVATWLAVRSALFDKKGPLSIYLGYVSVDDLDARLDSDPQGGLELADSFAPTAPSAPPNPKDRGLRFQIGRLAVKHAWAHGAMAGAPPLDVVADELAGAFLLTPDAMEGDVAHASITARAIAQGQDVSGKLVAHVTKTSTLPSRMTGRVDWEGLAAGVAHSIRATMDDTRVDAVVDAPHVDPANLRSVWPASTIDEVATLHAEAHGVLPSVDLSLHASVGPSTFDALGHAVVGDDRSAHVRFDSRALDVHQIAASAPTSRVGITGEIDARQSADGALEGTADIHFLSGPFGVYELPRASLKATASRTPSGELTASATLLAEEPNMPTRLVATVTPRGPSSHVAFDLRADAPDLDKVRPLRHTVQGGAHVHAEGTLDTSPMAIDARVDARVDHIVQGATRADMMSVDARAHGPVVNPRLSLAVRSEGLLIGGRLLSRADVTLSGALNSSHVVATLRGPELPDVDATVNVSNKGGFSLDQVRLSAVRGGERARVTAEHVKIAGDGIGVDNAVIDGMGSPVEATFSLMRGALHVHASTAGIDLERVGRVAHIEKTLRHGTLSFDADFDARRANATGRATVDLTEGALGSVSKIGVHLAAELAGRSVSGKVHAEAGGVGSLDVDAPKLDIAGQGPLVAASWRQISGKVGIDAQGDLARAIALLPPDAIPLDEARGTIVLHGHIARANTSDEHPEVDLTLSTDKLSISPKSKTGRDIDGVQIQATPSWRLEGIDFDVHGTINGRSGRIELDTHAKDKKGELVHLDVASNAFPFQDLFGDPGRLSSDLETTPVELEASVPERGLGSMPDMLKQNFLTGRLAANASLKGSVRAPALDLKVTLKRSHFEDNSRNKFIDFDLGTRYDGARAAVSLKGVIDGKDVITVDSQVDAAIAQLLASGSGARWKASAKGHFNGFPLEAFPVLDNKLISGDVTGDLTLTKLHEDARAGATLDIAGLKMGSFAYKAAHVSFTADGRSLDGTVHIDQDDGFAEAKGRALATWGASIAPVLAQDKPFDLTLNTKNFRISALLPFVEGVFDEFDGRLDADTHVELDPKIRGTKVSGTMALKDGTFQAVAGGGEFHDVAAALRFSPGVITLEKLSASGLTGRLEAKGAAQLDNMALQSATASLTIPDRAPIPVSAGGAEIGNIDGQFDVDAKAIDAGHTLAITVTVPHVRVALPSGSTTNAISLGPIDKVRLGSHRGHPATFMLLPMDPIVTDDTPPPSGSSMQTKVEANLEDAEVVRGTDLKVDLTGKLHIATGASTDVTGTIHLKKGGSLELQGKKFVVENGTVTMVPGDPANPQIVVQAGWTAPDGTVVYANFVGPLKTGKVTLTSEPSLSQEEIVQLLMFGTADGQQAQNPSTDPSLSAIGTAGGQASQPLNHMLNQLGLGAVSVKVDTNQTTPKPEVEVQIARDISLQIAVVLGLPPPGVNPDTTLLTVDWRFLSRWSLAATVGDAGTTIFDLLWHKRY